MRKADDKENIIYIYIYIIYNYILYIKYKYIYRERERLCSWKKKTKLFNLKIFRPLLLSIHYPIIHFSCESQYPVLEFPLLCINTPDNNNKGKLSCN